MKLKITFYTIICYTFLQVPVACAQNSGFEYAPKDYVCHHTREPLTIDGKLNEDDWKQAPWTDDFVDIEGDAKPKPLHRTRAKMLWDDQYFYIAAEIIEPDIWATYDQRDMVIFHENDFEVFIDPDGDTHQYYEFEINALGTYWDLMLIKPYLNGGPAIDSWDIRGLKSAIQIQGTLNNPKDKDKLWIVELAFPWAVLEEAASKGKKPQDGDHWRVNFSRVNWRIVNDGGQYRKKVDPETNKPYPEYNWVWSPQGVINMHLPEMWGFVQFSKQHVGTGEVKFKPNPEEDIKWLLRNLYYAEKQYYEQHGTYTSELTKLNLPKPIRQKINQKPEIETTESLFEIKYPAIEKGMEWHIKADGEIWKTPKQLSK